MINYYLKVNIQMEKEMEKEKDIIMMVKSILKVNIKMEKYGMEKVLIKIKR